MLSHEWRVKGSTYAHEGHPVFYRTGGEGPSLLCIHGFPTASWDWHRMWDGLTSRFHVVAPDLIGYGFSAKPRDYYYSTFDQADLVEELLTHLDIEVVHVLAHDYGATVAQELLARQTARKNLVDLASVCFLNAGLFPEAIHPRRIQTVLRSRLGPLVARLYTRNAFARSLRPLFGPGSQPSDETIDELWGLLRSGQGQRVVAKLIGYMGERERFRDRWVNALQSTDVPLRLAYGPEDPVSGRPMADRFRELVPDAAVVTIHGMGHFPHLEDPDHVLRAHSAFVDSLEPPAPEPEPQTLPAEGRAEVSRLEDGTYRVTHTAEAFEPLELALGSAQLAMELEVLALGPEKTARSRRLPVVVTNVAIGPDHGSRTPGLSDEKLLLIAGRTLETVERVAGDVVPISDLPIPDPQSSAQVPGSQGCAIIRHHPGSPDGEVAVDLEIGLAEPVFREVRALAASGQRVLVRVQGLAEGLTSAEIVGAGRDLLLEPGGHVVMWIAVGDVLTVRDGTNVTG